MNASAARTLVPMNLPHSLVLVPIRTADVALEMLERSLYGAGRALRVCTDLYCNPELAEGQKAYHAYVRAVAVDGPGPDPSAPGG